MPDQNHIVIQGLCQNNLKNISLKIPKQKLVVFTGVSGSGKSSIVFDTIAAESQRQMNETYSAYVRGRLPKYEKPKAERIENLSPSVIIDQNPLGGNARSTVGTISDMYSALRLLYNVLILAQSRPDECRRLATAMRPAKKKSVTVTTPNKKK